MRTVRELSTAAAAVVLCLLGLVSLSCAGRVGGGSRQNLAVEKHLRRLNKPPVKTIKTRPNFHPEGLFEEKEVTSEASERVNPIKQLWHVNGKCPENTIPVRRTTKDDVLRASSAKRYGRKKHRTVPVPKSADPDLINQSGHQSDAYQATGCYNLLCSGFIQLNSEIAMGASISPVSGYRNSQYDISILIWKL
ncbi:hypothetical protein SAY86_018115 [Trapa natans]|uniref:Neprosin PEP catalytic domain-containing protein n=1 Tax=Trapa natans TaxID=22666 RepID=A0AAN7LC54_TRANT|nr:hypothetical protein SAY86_018115 [Trapa natans]